MKVTSYKETKEELLKDPDVRAEYEALSLEYALSQSLSENRKKRKLTQKQLSEISGVDQPTSAESKTVKRILFSKPLKSSQTP